MIDLVALFKGGGAAGAGTGAGAKGQGDGVFAGLLAALKSGAGALTGAAGQGAGDLAQRIGGLIDGAEAALAVPDLSDAEIGDVLDGLIADLSALLAGKPQVAAQLAGSGGQAVLSAGPAEVGASVADAPADTPARLLAEALPALRELLTGMTGVAGEAAPGAAPGPALAAEAGPGLSPLLDRILRGVRAAAGQGGLQASVTQTAGPEGIVTAGPQGAQADAAGNLGASVSATIPGQALQARAGQQPDAGGPGANRFDPRTAGLGAEGNARTGFAATGPAQGTPTDPAQAAPSSPAAQVQAATAPGVPADTGAPAPVQAPPPAAQPLSHVPAQAAPPAAAPPPVDPREVLGQLRAHVGEQGRIRVELRPEGMGNVEIDLSADDTGQLRVVVRAENAAVLQALRGDRDGLAMMLRDAGHDVDDGAMSFGDFGGANAGTGGPGRGGWSPVLGGTAEPEPETDTLRPAPIPGARGVDMTV